MNICYFSQLWPKGAFSAAHQRTFGILDTLLINNFNINYITPQEIKKAAELKEYQGIKAFQADPSNTSRVAHVLSRVNNPAAAFFDTHVSESLYSHYVHQSAPNAIKILDLQDLHALRFKRGARLLADSPDLQSKEVLQAKPQLGEELVDKEITSLIRSDLILSCSDYELELIQEMNIAHKQIELITFFYPTRVKYEETEQIQRELIKRDPSRRKNFVFLGNMAHKPNLDAVKFLKEHIWPRILKALPAAQLHVYGSNFPQELKTDVDSGFICKGLMKELIQLGKYRVMLAPLRFGAGVKGKITDAWFECLPVVTTPIGAEGLFLESTQAAKYQVLNTTTSKFYSDWRVENLSLEDQKSSEETQARMRDYYRYEDPAIGDGLTFGGSFNNWTVDQFVENAIQLYSDEEQWHQAVKKGEKILDFRMSQNVNDKLLMKLISDAQCNLNQLRKKDVLQRLTWSETLRSNYHFAKYLDEKRKNHELLKGQSRE